jgi:CRP/FNR family transcriptional regulator
MEKGAPIRSSHEASLALRGEGWLADAPSFDGLEPEARAALAALTPVSIPAGAILFRAGAPCGAFPIVVRGAVRVSLTGLNGRTMTLYRVTAGQICVQTTLCLMGGKSYAVEGEAEAPTLLALIPKALFERLLNTSPAFRAYVFAKFGERFDDIARVLERVAFARVDVRLAEALLARADARGRVQATHQGLAEETGAAREVVTRHLNLFAQSGWVRLGRGFVEVVDQLALQRLAANAES